MLIEYYNHRRTIEFYYTYMIITNTLSKVTYENIIHDFEKYVK